jgi:hypothetical protein
MERTSYRNLRCTGTVGQGTQRLTLVKERDGEHWRAGDEIEQIGIISQKVVDLLAAVIKEVRS